MINTTIGGGIPIPGASYPCAVPSHYVGMHSHRFPLGRNAITDPPFPFNFGCFRTHDGQITWGGAHLSPGNFDWLAHDQIINYHHSQGRHIMYTIYGTPTWAARPENQSVQGPYGKLGEGSPPTDNQYLVEFVTGILSRYNSGGVRKIHYLELWNEPNFAQNQTGFYWGSVTDLVATSAAVATAAKLVDSHIEVVSPGFSGGGGAIDPWLNTHDPISGLKGVDLVDSVAIHPYTAGYYSQRHSLYEAGPHLLSIRRAVSSVALAGNKSLPIHISEYGLAGDPASAAFFLQLPQQQRRVYIARLLVTGALLGARTFGLYSYNSLLVGDLINDSGGVVSAINSVQQQLCGKTVTDAWLDQAGQIHTVIDGTTVTW